MLRGMEELDKSMEGMSLEVRFTILKKSVCEEKLMVIACVRVRYLAKEQLRSLL